MKSGSAVAKETNAKFVDSFLGKYLSLGFGNMPKKEIDILVFHLISSLGYIEGTDNYKIAKELRIDESRLRRLLIDVAARAETGDTVNSSLNELHSKIFKKHTIKPHFDKEAKTISFVIENPEIKRDFVYAMRRAGYSYDEYLNPDKVEIPIYVFIAVMCTCDDDIYQHFKENMRKTFKSQSDFEKAYKDGLPLLDRINTLLESAGPAIDTVAGIAALFG